VECPVSWGPWYNQDCGLLTCIYLVDKGFHQPAHIQLLSMVVTLVVVRVFLGQEILEMLIEGEGGLSFSQ
jgi:hypothetical protein